VSENCVAQKEAMLCHIQLYELELCEVKLYDFEFCDRGLKYTVLLPPSLLSSTLASLTLLFVKWKRAAQL